MPEIDRDRLRKIKTFPQLVKYLRDDLEWPIETENFEELTFEYDPEELGIDPKNAVKIEEIQQLRPLVSNQPWGIFFVRFGKNKLSVVALRRILSQLVIKKRASMRKADQPTWHLHDLLFISNYCEDNERKITFARFTQNEETNDLPTLKVLGWDEGDTALHVDHVQHLLHTSLRWPRDERNSDAWRVQWSSAFTLGHCEIIKTSKDLAIRLADLAKKIRVRALQVLAIESEKGPLRTLHKAFREALIHDLSEEDFADMYAQTIAYGLLAARVSRRMGIIADNMADMVPITNPFLKEMLSVFLTVGGRKSGINFDELGVQDIVDLLNNPGTHMEDVLRDFGNRTRQEDPVIHFYELFLKEYDRQKKVERGVFYTPQPVVSYIVRSVHELLQTELGLKDGLASTITWGEMIKKNPDLELPILKPRDSDDKNSKDITISPEEPFVTILDPATGTATFLVEVIDIIHNTMTAKWEGQGLKPQQIIEKWNEYVPAHLLPRLYGFELMMAPYAIAHMKIGLKLHETGYGFESDERVRVYLTNSLEPAADSIQRDLTYYSEALAHEATAVNEVKRIIRVTVIVGNPPYKGHSLNNQIPWIVDKVYDYKRGFPDLYKPAQAKWLQDDYVKFFRFSEELVNQTNTGILAFITNHGYLTNPTFRGMRKHLLDSFSKIFVFDLHGNVKKDENVSGITNVFDIQQGVAIGLFVKNSQKNKSQISDIQHFSLLGHRLEKNHFLLENSIYSLKYDQVFPEEPFYLFVPQDTSLTLEYNRGWKVSDIFSIYGDPAPGITTTHDEFAISWDPKESITKVELLLKTKTEDEARKIFTLCSQAQWVYNQAVSELKNFNFKKEVVKILYRPFDFRWTIYNRYVAVHRRERVMNHMLTIKNLGLCTDRQVNGDFCHVFVSRFIINDCTLSSATRERTFIFPLYLNSKSRDSIINDGSSLININKNFLKKIEAQYLSTSTFDIKTSKKVDEIDIFNYIYSILHSQNYRKRYSDFLKSDFPRIHLSNSFGLFNSLATLGSELVPLHLMESPKLNKSITEYIGKTLSGEIEKVTYSDNTVWIDKAKTVGFQGIPENVWNFHIGGYQVCEKWLKDRKGRQLSAEDIAHYQKIIVALNETIRIMGEIDEVIEKHGGWPGAFDTSGSGAEAAAGIAEQQTLFGDDPA